MTRAWRWVVLVGSLACAAATGRSAEWHDLTYAPAPVDNPLKGFVPYLERGSGSPFPHSLEWFYVPLADLMQGPEQFDWTPLERRLAEIAGRHHQTAMRVDLDYPGHGPGTPRFLLDEGVKARPYDGRKNAGRSVSPDYEDPRLRQALRTFIAAFGAKYDGDPRIGFITLGLLGYWGEWHTSDHPEWFASKAVQREVMEAYLRAFHRTRLLARYPAGPSDPYYAANDTLPLGYHDDSFAFATMPTGKAGSWYFLDRMTRAHALGKWRSQPIGGEVRPEVWDTMWNEPPGVPAGQEYPACVQAAHASWMMNTGVFRLKPGDPRFGRAVAGARILGYELGVTRSLIEPRKGGLSVTVQVKDDGVAPFYYDWGVELALADAQGQVVRRWSTPWQISRVEPGASGEVAFQQDLKGDRPAGGPYSVLMRVVDPLPSGRDLVFADAEWNSVAKGWLTLGSVEF